MTHVLITSIDVKDLDQHLTDFALPQDASLTLLDGAGTVLARPDSRARWTGKKAGSLIDATRSEGAEGSLGIQSDLDGVERRFFVTTVGALPDDRSLYVLVGMPQ